MSCRDVVQQGTSRCAAFAKWEECQCEQVQTTEFSPGPVLNEEILIRHIFSPLHFDQETRTLKPAAFADIWGVGFSVTRQAHSTLEQFKSLTAFLLGIKQQKNPQAELVCLLSISVDTMRAMRCSSDNGRLLCVYDTGSKSNPAHADLCTPRIPPNREEKAALRDVLTESFAVGCVDLNVLFN